MQIENTGQETTTRIRSKDVLEQRKDTPGTTTFIFENQVTQELSE